MLATSSGGDVELGLKRNKILIKIITQQKMEGSSPDISMICILKLQYDLIMK
jgi:hypothetical protein